MDRGYEIRREKHPKDCASFLSLLTFAYIFKLIRKGRRKEIDENDLTNVMSSMKSKKVGDDLEKCWKKNSNQSVIRALFSCYGTVLLVLWIAHLIKGVIHIYSVPWAVGKFVSYFENGQTNISRDEALLYAIIMISISTFNGFWGQHYHLWKTELAIRMQTSLSSLLYRKALTLSQAELSNISTGTVVTAITKDVLTINNAILFGLDNIGDFVQIGLISNVLYQKVGVASFGGIGIIFLSIFSQLVFARCTYKRRGACNEKTDERLKQTKEVLSSIRLIKMYAWESFFEKRILLLRKIELKNLYVVFILKSLSRIIGSVSEKIAHILTLLIYLWLGGKLNADIVYFTTKLFRRVLRIMVIIPLGIQSMSEFLVSLKRINKIIHSEESHVCHRGLIQTMKPQISFIETDVKIKEIDILKGINLKLKTGLNILIGPSGCGKSSVLKTILEEYKTTNGKTNVQGTVSYASQNPWLFPSSLKQNILFGEPLNEYKYKKILEICGLNYDISTFAIGDEVVLTDCGINLSKGQQARINLARALYRESDIYLLDDSLASLDINIKKHVFNDAIKNYLRNKLCLLVTHSTQFVHQADNVIIMEAGRIKYTGIPQDIPPELLKQRDVLSDIINEDLIRSKDENEEGEDFSKENTKLLSNKQDTKKCNIYKESKEGGKVKFEVYKGYVQYGGGLIMLFSICGAHIICEVSNGLGEKFLSKWLNAQKVISSNISAWSNISSIDLERTVFNSTSEISTESYSSTVSSDTVSEYGKFSTTFSEVTAQVLNITMEATTNDMKFFDYFVGATFFATIFTLVGALINYYFAVKIARKMHGSMVNNLLQGCMNFFDTNLIGNVLTRFSRDMYFVDEFIPFLWHGFKMIFVLGMSFILIATVKPLFACVFIFMAVIFYFISDYFLSTSRNLQRLNSSTLSPMIGVLNSTLEGLITIRAHGTQHILKDEFDKHQDLFVTANHLKEITTKVLGFYCHLIESIFTSFVTLRLLFLQGVLAGDAGLVLTQASSLSHHIEWALMLWVLMETSMTSVERILEYTRIPRESKSGQHLENWPHRGEIKFRDVSLTYPQNGETVLKNLNFIIHPQEKIGVVGRTGAGKSSIILTLFRMYNFDGDITIDDVNIKTLSLDCLRTHLAIIPQDPVIFSGSVRSNIDPFEKISDEEIWKILEVVNLKTHFKDLFEDVTEKNLSIGQKQLISIGRALTRETKIVIMDEATANMDEAMDSFIHQKISELFKACTVITVAHRLSTVMNSDRILVMDNGEIVEFDTPQKLFENNKGLFYRMVESSS